MDDPRNPMNMPAWRKWACAGALGAMTFAATFSSSVFNAAIPVTAREFGVSIETMSLATALFVFGFATGPIVMGPASEVFGRKSPFFLGYLAFVLLQIPVALGKDATTVLVFRFLSGVASAGSPAIVGGYLADFMAPLERGIAVAIFAATTLLGPEVGAIVGAVVVQSSLGWRWTAWISLILSGVFSFIGFFLLPETYMPVLEKRRAQELRLETKQWALHSRLDETPVSLKDFATRYMTRPAIMLSVEPILALMTLYISFVFGLVYLLFVAYPISFVQQRGFSLTAGTLPLLAVCVGIIIGATYVTNYSYTTLRAKAMKNGKLEPEDRLPPMIVGAVWLTIGLFWFAWTSMPNINPWPQILSGVPLGFGIQVISLQSLAYLIDIYLTSANSAISGTVIVRSLVGGLFPLFAPALYGRLHVFWATTLLGCCALALTPIPIVFYIYGARIRSHGRYTRKA
ncbi:hypothetical protein M409DRAFT_62374 [Zasmidium cellare ATCC 36951]|uniref:Major facilitator superfamily (MFS) profile domain-containing protein n=1 Tax=Zasmidium cellare ATCC 36951 TaxID=1080233 RepID=A0A6A6D333_ZASCE|nr:uncharacterized protein M409DRAFT_62374 [Zasmidium cellare ATCC 36951]KAF2172602.1 hypothetical protein M409DRAFT_62374 [Zasmidium cellare ATCC 36951]